MNYGHFLKGYEGWDESSGRAAAVYGYGTIQFCRFISSGEMLSCICFGVAVALSNDV